jgi:type I restriction enzyme, S subunit
MSNSQNGWSLTTFADIVLMSQYGLSCAASTEGNIPLLRMNNLSDDGLLDISDVSYVKLSDAELKRFLLQRGDLLFNRTNSFALVGKATVFDLEGSFVCASYLIRFKLDTSRVEPQFINYFFNSAASKAKLRRLATRGVSQSNINPTVLQRRFLIPTPPLPEQREIIEILSAWDRSIRFTKQLIETKVQFKRALAQQVLTGKKRIGGSAGQQWQRMKISEFTCHSPRVKPKPKRSFTALGIRSHGKGTFLKPDFDPSKIEMTELFEVKEKDLIVNITFAWEGAIAIAAPNDDGALVSHRFPTYEFKTKLAIPEFFRHVIRQKSFIEKLGIISPGGAGRNRVLSKKDFGKLEVLMPSVEEQRRIAAVLNTCDKEIELLKHQLDALKLQKRGLMQKLLTGQIRVKFADEIKEGLSA